jgi:hypothetical protein
MQDMAIAKEVGDRAGKGRACANIGHLGEYVKAVAYYKGCHAMASFICVVPG